MKTGVIHRLATAGASPDLAKKGELRRRIGAAVGAMIALGVVIAVVLSGNESQARGDSYKAQLDIVCSMAHVGVGNTCPERVANLAENTTRVRVIGTMVYGQMSQAAVKEGRSDPNNPCGPGDNAGLCTCKRELLEQQNGERLSLEPECATILRAGGHDPA